jgi:cell division septation protein DedD
MTICVNSAVPLRARLAWVGALVLSTVWWTPFVGSAALAQSPTATTQPAKKPAAKAKPKAASDDAEPAGSEASRDGTAAWRDYDAGLQLLQRGIAFRQEGKPGQAVADLTSAMYLRNGLTEPEKAEAMAQRSASYREAGLSEQGVATTGQARSTAVTTAVASGGNSARSASSAVSVPGPGPVAGLAPGGETPTAAPSAAASSGGGFFGKLFGSSDSAAAAPVPAAAPAPPTAAVSAWSNTEQAAPANTGKAGKSAAGTKVAAAKTANEVLPWERPAGAPDSEPAPPASKSKPAASVAAKPGNPAGKFRLQLAAVMSREEAQASAARVKSQFGADIGSRAATIDEAPLGSSTMYIVRFGPYASAAEIKTLCTRIRAAGTDCLQAP